MDGTHVSIQEWACKCCWDITAVWSKYGHARWGEDWLHFVHGVARHAFGMWWTVYMKYVTGREMVLWVSREAVSIHNDSSFTKHSWWVVETLLQHGASMDLQNEVRVNSCTAGILTCILCHVTKWLPCLVLTLSGASTCCLFRQDAKIALVEIYLVKIIGHLQKNYVDFFSHS